MDGTLVSCITKMAGHFSFIQFSKDSSLFNILLALTPSMVREIFSFIQFLFILVLDRPLLVSLFLFLEIGFIAFVVTGLPSENPIGISDCTLPSLGFPE